MGHEAPKIQYVVPVSVLDNGIKLDIKDILNWVQFTVDKRMQPSGLRRSLWTPGPLPPNLVPESHKENLPPQFESTFEMSEHTFPSECGVCVCWCLMFSPILMLEVTFI